MSQRERDAIKVVRPVLTGARTQAQAAGLLGLTVRQVRRVRRKLERGGGAAVHGSKGRPSNRQPGAEPKRKAPAAYRPEYPGFGPTSAAEKPAEHDGLEVGPQTPRR